MSRYHQWVKEAIQKIEADFNRSSDTHLIRLDIPSIPHIQLYLKDESTHPTGSLKHRLARSLFLYGLSNGWIKERLPIIEASSGSTAISEAYFARLLGIPFIAVMPKSTSPSKITEIEFYGGRCHLVDDPSQIYTVSQQLAQETGGHYMDQFTYAERATDWRGNNNIAESIFQQMRREPHAEPTWIVCGAGTGGTSATIGRYIRYGRFDTRLCVVDPDNSVFYEFYRSGDPHITRSKGSNVEGIGRPRVEPSFIPNVIDIMLRIPNAATYAAIHFLDRILGRKCGGSTGTNLYGAIHLMSEMDKHGLSGSVVTLICDSGVRYLHTYYNHSWLKENGYEIGSYLAQLQYFYDKGEWPEDHNPEFGLKS
jgi:cysteine synthase A